jgi:hypothetical protein
MKRVRKMTERGLEKEETKRGIQTTLESLFKELIRIETEKNNTLLKISGHLEEEREATEYLFKLLTALAAQLKLIGLLPADFKVADPAKNEEVV